MSRPPGPDVKPERDTDWQDLANCRGLDTEIFFTERGESTREAKAICRECDVRAECLAFAINNGEKFGIWGGLSAKQRRALVRKHRRAALLDRSHLRVVS